MLQRIFAETLWRSAGFGGIGRDLVGIPLLSQEQRKQRFFVNCPWSVRDCSVLPEVFGEAGTSIAAEFPVMIRGKKVVLRDSDIAS